MVAPLDALVGEALLPTTGRREPDAPDAPVRPPLAVPATREEHATDELFARSPAASLQFLRPMIAFGVVYSLTVIPLMILVLGRTWHAPLCSPLRSWVLLHLGLQSVQLPFRLLLHHDLRAIAPLHDEEAARRLLQLSRSLLWCVPMPRCAPPTAHRRAQLRARAAARASLGGWAAGRFGARGGRAQAAAVGR